MSWVRLCGPGRSLGAAVLVAAWCLLPAGEAVAQIASIDSMFESLAGMSGQSAGRPVRVRRMKQRGANEAQSARRASLMGTLAAVKPAGLPLGLAAAVVNMESGWRVNARGSSGEIGLMQLMPATARRFGGGNLWDPANNMRVGTRFLYWCYQQAGGNVATTIGCYNRGPALMRSWSRNPITRRYVSRVNGYLGKNGGASAPVVLASSSGGSGASPVSFFSWRE